MLQRFSLAAARVHARASRLPFYSTVHGRELLDGEATDAGYWTEHICAPVRFEQAARRLLADQRPQFVIEIGPKPVLAKMFKALIDVGGPTCVPVCRGEDTDAAALAAVIAGLGLNLNAEEEPDPVRDAVYASVAELVDDPSVVVGPDLALRGDLGFDSVMVMQLTFQLERRLPELGKLSLPDMLDSLVTPATVVEYLRAQLSADLAA
jgi:acyl carrier protein